MNLKEFVDPPKSCRPEPIWSWNSQIDSSEIETQIRDMKKKGFGGFIIRAASGLKTPYLGDDWIKAVRRAAETANELKIEAWLHDEDRSFSGYAGGAVVKDNDDYLPVMLTWAKDAQALPDDIIDRALAFTRKGDDGSPALLGEKPDDFDGVGVFYELRMDKGQPQFNGQACADLLNPKAVKSFIDLTHERYSKDFKYDFGEFMPGFFTDGPTPFFSLPGDDIRNTAIRVFPWTTGFAAYFEGIKGYSPLDRLHYLLGSGEDEGFTFRHDYWTAVVERFIESFTAPVSSWLSEHELKFSGRFDSLRNRMPAFSDMPHYEYLDSPGAGVSKTGAVTSAKKAASTANQFGKDRVTAHIPDQADYGTTFEDLKQEAGHRCALGATSFAFSHMPYSLIGTGKSEEPSSFSYHQPYWDRLRTATDFIARCSWAVRQGNSTASVLILSPFGSICGSHDTAAEDGGETARTIEKSFERMLEELSMEHIPFDISDERIMARHGVSDGDVLSVGQARYKCVILPRSLTWKSPTVGLLEAFTGPVFIMGDVPARVDGATDDRVRKLSEQAHVVMVSDEPADAVARVAGFSNRTVSVTGPDGKEARSVILNHRTEAAANLIFLASTDTEKILDVTVTIDALGGVVELDPATGRAYRYNAAYDGAKTIITTNIAPAGVRIFLVDQTQTSVDVPPSSSTEKLLAIEGPYSFRTLNENCLVIDRCTLEMDGRTILKDKPVSEARNAVWKATGLDEFHGYQPWVLKERNIRSRTNETTLTFTFTVTDIPESIAFAMETSDAFKLKLNGEELDFTPGRWHIDRRIRVFNLTGKVVEGVNTVTATTDFLWDTQIENVYVTGDFALGSKQDGFPLIREPETLGTGDWASQGYPFYPGSIAYKMEFALDKDEETRYEIDLSGTAGSVFTVTVNDEEVGVVAFSPFRGDITDALVQGDNTVEIEVAGTLAAMFAPLRPDSERNSAVPCGLMKPPKLVRIVQSEP